MRKSHLTLGRACLGALAAGVLTAAFGVPGVALASSTCCGGQQCFTASVSAASTGAGATTEFTFDITNESSRYPLNQVTISAPATVEITGASVASEPAASVTPASDTAPAASVTIGTPAAEHGSAPAGALSLAPGASLSVTVTAILPCLDGTYSWTVTGTNDGDNDRDDFQLNTSASSLSSTVAGSCSLAFLAQPAQTAVNDTITSMFNSGDLGSAPVEVEVLSDTVPAQVVTDATAPVTVAIENNPANGTLSGPGTVTAVNAVNGIAQFSGLSINEAGDPYTLEAVSPGITSATSAPFQISTSISLCPTSSCTAEVPGTTTTGSITTTSPSAGDYLAVGLGGVSYSCGSYPLTSAVVSFDLLSAAGVAQSSARFSGTLTISAAAVATSGHPALWTWQLCYASSVPFKALPTTAGTTDIGGVTYYTGLLPYCSWYQAAPCVQYKYKDKAGDVVIAFLATGDPMGRG